jgi:hypothetical protein
MHLVITNAKKTTSLSPNPAYTSWVARDQAVLGYLLSSLTRETLVGVFCIDKNRVVKITRSSFEMDLRTTKHIMIYPDSGPSSDVIVLRPVV